MTGHDLDRREWFTSGCWVGAPIREGETGEVFEVVDRLTGRRAMEHVHLTAQAALDWLGALDEKYHRQYRVQSVRVFRASS